MTTIHNGGPTNSMFGRGRNASSFVRISVDGVTVFRDITPEQYVRSTVGNEIRNKKLLNPKVVRAQKIALPGAPDAYAMTLTGMGPQKTRLRQDVVALRATPSSETAMVIASATVNQLGVLSPIMGSISYTKPSQSLGPRRTIASASAATRQSFHDSLKAAPK